ncbi:CoA-binding protein [Candidatus Micrarchaeota archaeon]|nr:CoA-binding protein [Candidatus Micrarchaeota archaeon]
MSLGAFFKPKSVAVIGASSKLRSVGYGVLRNLVTGGVFQSKYAKPFNGEVYAVNPNADKVLGRHAFNSVLGIPGEVDLAVVCVPSEVVPKVTRECSKKGVKACIIISAGFAEAGNKELQAEVLKAAGRMRVLGPNTLGVIAPSSSMNASFGLTTPAPGSIAFLTQSGAIADSVIDWAIEEEYAFSAIVSLGNAADVALPELIEHFVRDRQTKVICCYVEGIRDGKAFLNALRNAKRRGKAVVVLKAGRSASGKKAVSTHTGSVAGSHKVFEGALEQGSAISVDNLNDLFLFAKALDFCPKPKSNGFVVVSNAGGVAVLLSDYCEKYGVKLVELKESTLRKLDRTRKMHPAYSRRNPLDLVGDATPERYEAALKVLLRAPYVAGLFVAQTLQTMTDPAKNAEIIVEAKKRGKPILTVFLGGKYSRDSMLYLNGHRIADFNDPERAVKAAAALLKFAGKK